jgi:hypothetical protein
VKKLIAFDLYTKAPNSDAHMEVAPKGWLREVYLAVDVDARELQGTAIHKAQLEMIAKLKTAHDRYERLRRLSPREFHDLFERNIREGIPFDTLVDGLGN